jgi:DNA-binding transcriptional MocR family regulator
MDDKKDPIYIYFYSTNFKFMLLTIIKNSKVKKFDQIFNQIAGLIKDGTIAEGYRLPSTRSLAKTIGVNRTTVLRVYEELTAQGYIESSPGSYTTVRKKLPIVVMQDEGIVNIHPDQSIYKDYHDLNFEALMYYLENGKSLEKGKINFLQLSPDTRLLNKQHIKACMREVLNNTETNPFDFTHARGYKPLRQEIVKQMRLHNIYADDKNILITNGSLHSLQLVFQAFSKPGDYIAIENPTYSILLLIVKIFKLKVIEIPITNEGMDLKVLEKELSEKPIRFIYTMPTYQNPTGISMPQSNREKLVKLGEEKKCIIIEDSIEEELKYSGKAYLPIKSVDKKSQIIYLGTYTKIMAPGLRIGWIIGTPECIKKLTVLKSIFEISSSTINQMFLYHFLTRGVFDLHMKKTIRVFKNRMKVAVASIKNYIPSEKIEWTEPFGGYMIWIKLLTKPIINIENHFSDYGVILHNGKYFFSKEPPNNYIRICIAQTNETEIVEGIKKIGDAIKALN